MGDPQIFVFQGPNVAISCEVQFEEKSSRYIAKGEGWTGFSSYSAKHAALNCFVAWLTDNGAFYEGMTMKPQDYPLQDGPSFAHDVKPLEEELALAKAHPEYGIDTEAVEAALREAKADAAGRAGR